ncbi:pentatricopeptide repeat-containing protein At4g02750 [Selaginella moellendorffii]|uniref:pentatricopeptide repeat-containing protein At4g02750 n=1 Tax=Selaginella moellendorffii TaxID=88036 RepID=UPI000D1D10E2|nr:pentatricopeptide repeat-containing protein At4g02750 [Selaginella moellendorffii]|eukprot:XP_002982808.2 pentatricopeptide repeat-containing protein At4g02750 [Selaginella moellendorffii]
MGFVTPRRPRLLSKMGARGVATVREAVAQEEEVVAAGDVRIPFGQHQGQPLKSLPEGYLKVLARMARSKWGLLAEEVLSERGSVDGCRQKANAILEQEAFARLLRNASSLEAVELVRARIDESGVRHNAELLNVLIQVYGKYGCLVEAKQVLDGMRYQNGESWNTMILMYAQNGRLEEAKRTFDAMPVRDAVCWITMLRAYAAFELPGLARVVFEAMPMHDLESATEMMEVLLSKEERHRVKLVFDEMVEKDVCAYNSMLRAYTQEGHSNRVRATAEKMPEWDVVTVNTMLQAFASEGSLENAERLFDEFPERNEETISIMLRAYAASGCSEAAQAMFDRLVRRNEELWTFLVTAYSRAGQAAEAKLVFDKVPGKSDLSWAVLTEEYAQNLQLEDAEAVFDKVPKWSVRSWIAMIWAYAQSGHEQMARIIFNRCSTYDAGVWNAFIAGMTVLGRARDAIQLLRGMNLEGFPPDKFTFLNLLNACSAECLARQGGSLFKEMVADHGMTPWKDHYSAMVELLGRAKYLKIGQVLANSMPFEPDYATWKALFHACRHHRDLKLGLRVAKELILLDRHNALPYTLLAESYAAAGKQDKVAVIQRVMEKTGIKKNYAASWILVKGKFQNLMIGDAGHPENSEIRAQLRELVDKIGKEGYKPDTTLVLDKNMSEKEREDSLLDHSEKLSLAFGMVSTKPRCPLRIINSSRVCSDCHNALRLASLVTGRLIVLRDDSRIHHFERGKCSCRDFCTMR